MKDLLNFLDLLISEMSGMRGKQVTYSNLVGVLSTVQRKLAAQAEEQDDA